MSVYKKELLHYGEESIPCRITTFETIKGGKKFYRTEVELYKNGSWKKSDLNPTDVRRESQVAKSLKEDK